MFILLNGIINAKSYKETVGSIIDWHSDTYLPDDEVVFIFPANANKKALTPCIYKRKENCGFPPVADLQRRGIPTLGLPVVGVPKISEKDVERLHELAFNQDSGSAPEHLLAINESIANLWRAAGAGLDLALPVRPKSVYNKKYFVTTLEIEDEENSESKKQAVEPNFWGGTTIANPLLAEYYLSQLELLRSVSNSLIDELPDHVPEQFKQAFQQGKQATLGHVRPLWIWPDAAHDKLEKIKNEILSILSTYTNDWWKLAVFGHHHQARGEAVKAAILKAQTLDEIEKILINQDKLFKGKEINPAEVPVSLDKKFSCALKNKPKDASNPGGFHKCILESLSIVRSESGNFAALIDNPRSAEIADSSLLLKR